MLKDFLSEINGIAEEFDDYKIKIWCFDTEVHAPESFESWDGKDITSYTPQGYGGTDIGVNWRWMQENEVKPPFGQTVYYG